MDLLHVAHALAHSLKELDESSQKQLGSDLAETIKKKAIGATISGLASGWVPGIGGTIATGICIGYVWSMYLAINKKVGLSFADNIVKTLASGILTNLAGYAVVSVLGATLLSFVPGIGSITATIIMGAVCYELTIVSGILYMKILTNLFIKKNSNNISMEDIKEEYENMSESVKKELLKSAIKEGKKVAKENKK